MPPPALPALLNAVLQRIEVRKALSFGAKHYAIDGTLLETEAEVLVALRRDGRVAVKVQVANVMATKAPPENDSGGPAAS